MVPPYYPASNSAAERVVQTIKDRLKKSQSVDFRAQITRDGVTPELQRLQQEDIAVPVKTSESATPIVPVLKLDGCARICGDMKVTINRVTTVAKDPLPLIEDLWEKYNLLRGMRPMALHLSGILVTGSDDGDHLQDLHNVLARLQDARLKLKLEKCVFLAASVE
ncbi:uncharacterized protein [Dermacentor andersoni]|uniref:uncharacterized protein n=1 Tax=Dermacentor andersoni TaxID=34620 RepID=UPI003B3A830D